MRDVYQISPRKPIEVWVQLAFYINIKYSHTKWSVCVVG